MLRFVDAGTWTLVDVSRSGWLPTELADAFRGSAVAEQVGLWPLTYVSATSSRAIQVGLNGVSNYSTTTEVIAPIWAQGFMVTSLSSTDVQLRHRGTGYCVVPTATGFGLATCITNPPSISPQRLRVTYLNDGSMQLRSASLGQCVTEVNNQVTMRPCSAGTPGQGWFQGVGRR